MCGQRQSYLWIPQLLINGNEKQLQYTDFIQGGRILTPRDQVPVVLQDHLCVQGPLGRVQNALFLPSEVHSHNFEVHAFLKRDTHFCSAGRHFLPMFTEEEKCDRCKTEMGWELSWGSQCSKNSSQGVQVSSRWAPLDFGGWTCFYNPKEEHQIRTNSSFPSWSP